MMVQNGQSYLLDHAGPDRVFSELRRTYWTLRGRQPVKKHQWKCTECQMASEERQTRETLGHCVQTTRCVHLNLLCNMDTDSFLLALRRFVARRGKPYKLLCDQGTIFRGGERELQEAFASLNPELQEQLAKQNNDFKFNTPHAPHFGGAWKREIKSVKTSLQVVLKDLILPEEALRFVLIEVKGIMNLKPLGYVSSDISDPDPII